MVKIFPIAWGKGFSKFSLAVLSLAGCVSFPNVSAGQGAAVIPGVITPLPLLVLGAGSSCLRIVYDANGNRVEQIVSAVGPGGLVWGSGTYGCTVWQL